MTTFPNSGKTIRLGRVLNPADGRAAVVAYDHGSMVGVIPGNENPGDMLETLAEGGADALMVAPGIARTYASVFAGRGAPALIVRIDWWNLWRGEGQLPYKEGSGRLIATVEDAARLGADAILIYMILGMENSEFEANHVETIAKVAHDCDKMGIGCIIEPMARGALSEDPLKPEYIALGSRMACELGADVLKIEYTGNSDTFKGVTEAAFRPILIAGGPKTSTLRDALAMLRGALDAGASGSFIGRNVFQAENPRLMMQVMASMIHENWSVDEALEALNG
jgi:class I fructose-bisphosphate aldolase